MPEWVTAILEWIRLHPAMAGLTIALVAFLEGLALVGIVVPGIVILFGFGALVGLGVLDLATVWIWCSAGAILGDGLSFWLGHHFKSHIRDVWPFTRFRDLLRRGEEFFRRHGLKSVLIGRFVGPIRPIMPVVAGMMNMRLRRYLPANVLAGVLWSPVYMLPGIVFGASIELAKAVAWRLALLICVLAVLVWGLSWGVRGAYRYLAPHASRFLTSVLRWSQRHPLLGRFTRPLVDPQQPESGTLALFAVLLLLAAWGLVSLLIAVPLEGGSLPIDRASAAAVGELRTPWADQAMDFLLRFGSLPVLLPAAALVLAWLLWRRRRLAAYHWLAALAIGFALAAVIGYLLSLSRTPVDGESARLLPIMDPVMSVVGYGFFAILAARELPRRRRVWPYVVATLLVALSAFAALYFDAYRMSDLMIGISLGVLWITILGIAYRRHSRRSFWVVPPATLMFGAAGVLAVVTAGGIAGPAAVTQAPGPVQVIAAEEWWGSAWTAAAERPINVQLAGELEPLLAALEQTGWEKPPLADWRTALEMMQPAPTPRTLPVLPAAFHNRPETAVLNRWDPAVPEGQWVLRVWATPVVLDDGRPLWVAELAWHELRRLLYFFQYWHQPPPTRGPDTALPNLAGYRTRQLGSMTLIEKI